MQAMLRAMVAAAVGAAVVSPADAGPVRQASGTFGDVTWQAASKIVGVNSTATLAGGGDPRYFAPMPQYSGVAALIMDFGPGGLFICSGTLLPNRKSILTAAHCVTDGALNKPIATTAWFYGGPDPDTFVPFNAASTPVAISNYAVHPDYTGEVIDDNDIAVLTLATLAPAWATSFDLYTPTDLTGEEFNVAGYGARSLNGGNEGATLGVGRLRQGDNRYEYRLGDPDFVGGWELILGEPTAQIDDSYLSDFDNGLAGNDTSCLVAADPFFGLGGPKFCNLGLGLDEVSVAGGDSGGPQFINDLIASVTSYGLTFGSPYGDVDDNLNSSFGEFNGFVPVYIHEQFIRDHMVPEPPVYALLGLGLLGLFFRSRRQRIA